MQIQTQVEAPHIEDTWKDSQGQQWAKVYIADTDFINNNGWGLSDQEVLDNLNKTGIDAPGLLTDYIYHPRRLHNIDPRGLSDSQLIQRMQQVQEKEGKVLYRHKTFYRDKDNPKRIYSNVLITDPKAVEAIEKGFTPRYVSAGALLLDQPNGKGISRKFYFLHSAIVKKPAFPFAHSIIKAFCKGSEDVCNQSLAVAGIQMEDDLGPASEECSLCPLDTFKKISSSVGSNYVISSIMTDLDKIEENPKVDNSIDTNQVAKETKQPDTQKQAVKVPEAVTNTQSPTQAAVEQAVQQQPNITPITQEELLKSAMNKIEEQGKIIEILKADRETREVEKRKEIIASYVNRAFAHDNKKAEETAKKYLEGGFAKLTDVELIDILKDRFGEQVIEVETRSKGKYAKAGIEDYVTNDANLAGNTDVKTKTRENILSQFSSLVEERRNGVI